MLKRLLQRLIADTLPAFLRDSLTGADGRASGQRMAALTAVWVAIGATAWGLYAGTLDVLSAVVAWLSFAAAALGFAFMGSTKYWSSGSKEKEGGNG